MKPVRFSICGKAYEYQMSHITRYLMKLVEKSMEEEVIDIEKSETKKIDIELELHVKEKEIESVLFVD